MPFKEYFDIPETVAYLNTPGNGVIPRHIRQWRLEREELFFDVKGSLRDQQADFIQQVRTTIKNTFHVTKGNVFCTPNFSFAFTTLIDRLPDDTRFLLLNEDYPSLNYPVINRGFSYYAVDLTVNLENSIREAIRIFKPSVFLLSVVQYINGMKIDLDFIKELKRENPQLIIIADGTQFLGTSLFDFENSGFDAIGASGYKWLLSGYGNGFMIVGEELEEILAKKSAHVPRPKEAMWSSKSILQTFFEPGHQDTLSHGTLQQSLLFLQDLGLQKIQQHIANLSEIAHQELSIRKLLLPEIEGRHVKSSLINIQVSPNCYPELMSQGIACFPRGTGIRIGIHLYNGEEDIVHLLNTIDQHK
ncbi:aminotransferase class V-fold PLP-dependent enzyme [Sphingobacterium sp. LRF_L2]|uniref:aminotransferase class V-fold PLP-dependent enzyme n=1 Tax=Sphingobacterium sp. LRF_L2 TaxID=3369421 RepID=UPI003F5FAD32